MAFQICALKFKFAKIHKLSACSVLCVIRRGKGGWGGKGEEFVT